MYSGFDFQSPSDFFMTTAAGINELNSFACNGSQIQSIIMAIC